MRGQMGKLVAVLGVIRLDFGLTSLVSRAMLSVVGILYTSYKNEKAKFFDAVWNVVNWQDVERRLTSVSGIKVAA